MSDTEIVHAGERRLPVDELSAETLRQLDCPPSAGLQALPLATVDRLLPLLDGWQRNDQSIERRFAFANWLETLTFVSTIGWLAHRQDHHPDLAVTYRHCRVCLSTHSVGGLSINDLICAARISELYGDRPS